MQDGNQILLCAQAVCTCVVFLMKYCLLELPYLYLTATNNKEFTGKSSLTSFCAESSEKKK